MSNPKYPVYIISKSRAGSRQTSKAFEKMGVPYHIVIEPQEYPQYSAVIDPAKILQLPDSNLGLGSIPARNFVWEHAIGTGAARHWVFDDNIRWFARANYNATPICADGTIFQCMEDWVDRYDNVAQAGLQYFMFNVRKEKTAPIILNTRIYSMILLQNDLPYRWRGRYNEDTDLSLRILKDGNCTVLFTAFLGDKVTTGTMQGGNADELYQGDGRLEMAESLVAQHPDVVTVTQKFGRWQHQVNYKPFRKNELKLKSGLVIPEGFDNYGMRFEEKIDDTWVPGDTRAYEPAPEKEDTND